MVKLLKTTVILITRHSRATGGLRPDRADVITHASKIYLTVMKKAGVKDMFVPKVGLADGIINQLYNKHISKIMQ